MKKIFLCFGFILFLLVNFRAEETLAATLADGTYSINYSVLENGTDSVSIADGYFSKPATVTIKDQQATVELQVTNSSWITSFSAGSNNRVLSSDTANDTRKIQFTTSSINQPFDAKMKVDIDDMDYHHSYTVQLKFETDSASLIASATENSETSTTPSSTDNTSQTEESTTASSATTVTSSKKTNTASATSQNNPQTGDSQAGLLSKSLFILSGLGIFALFTFSKLSKGV